MRRPAIGSSVREPGGTPATYAIVKVNAPAAGYGPASQISYDMIVNWDEGQSRYDGVVPRHNRWPDSVNTQPAAVGTEGTGVITASNEWHPTIIETIHVVDCPQGGTFMDALMTMRPDQIRAVLEHWQNPTKQPGILKRALKAVGL